MRTAVVIGASFAGLLAAAALAQSDTSVLVLERDRLPLTGPESEQPRPGVPQGRQPHVLLHRGLTAIDALLPGTESELLERGGVPFNTAQMLWLDASGWRPRTDWAFGIISISRPLLESVVRARVAASPQVQIVDGVRVDGLSRTGEGWRVGTADGRTYETDLVVDASGRGSRLPHWLADLGVDVPEPESVEAKVGYACRAYRGRTDLDAGIAISATPEAPAGGLALPIENDGWLVVGAGYGERRPGRSLAEFDSFLRSLADTALADLTDELDPVGEVIVHRQTGNRRLDYGRVPNWPAGLLVTGDALCAFNPVFGQGITVAACQAELLRSRLSRIPGRLGGAETRVLQRRIAAITDLPWTVATGEDQRMLGTAARSSRRQRVTNAWSTRMLQLVDGGDEACTRAFAGVYHLMGSPLLLISPPVVAAVLRSMIFGVPPAAPRPDVLTPTH